MLRKHPHLIEIQAAHLLHPASGRAREISLSAVPDAYWKNLADMGFDCVWLMGVWKRSPAARKIVLGIPDLRRVCSRLLPDFNEADMMGSPYAVYSYELEPSFGSPEDLSKLHKKINGLGLKLILDFVPNHLALDHPAIETNPEYFVQASREDFDKDRDGFFKTAGDKYFPHGKDPYFPGWTDTVQVNFFSPGYRAFSRQQLLKMAEVSDGVRCDMAMLGLSRVFQKGWGHYLGATPMPPVEYWKDVIATVKEKHPSFIFLAEAYWDMEWELQQLGFDFTYDKKLYDRLLYDAAQSVRGHLKADSSYQNKSARFIENHDEICAGKAFGTEKSQAAAVIMATVPGMRIFHQGQLDGKNIKVPIQLRRAPDEKPIKLLKDFYLTLLEYCDQETLHEGTWRVLEIQSAWQDNPAYLNLIAWGWEHKKQVSLIVVNYSGATCQGRVKLPLAWLGQKNVTLRDKMESTSYVRDAAELKEQGLYVALKPWKAHLFEFSV